MQGREEKQEEVLSGKKGIRKEKREEEGEEKMME